MLFRSASLLSVLLTLLCGPAASAQARPIITDSTWLPILIDTTADGATTLTFRNGHRLQLGLVEVALLGQLAAPSGAPFLVLGGRSCSECDIERKIYVIRADADSIVRPAGYYYPGTAQPGGEDSTAIFYRGRLFIGRCLASSRAVAVWFQSEKDSTSRWSQQV